MKAASSAEHIKGLARDSSDADFYFQRLDKLRIDYEEYTKIGNETIPLAEKKLQELTEELEQKSQAFDDVSIFFRHFLSCNRSLVSCQEDEMDILLVNLVRLWSAPC